jgi:hypothetical protein
MQLNSRTIENSQKYQGEFAPDPIVQAELQTLAQRQQKLRGMLDKIVSGANQ